ncbi:ABC transporter permease [Cryptosporangium sp. NPDC051539]|uniref:ABC transporter permease n=1 Tax=Cryptosporangium sp. NPDC051539 TaxID=3363962 RepID=UPI0037A6A022
MATILTPDPATVRSPRRRLPASLDRSEVRWLLWPPLAFFAVALGIPLAELVVQALRGDSTGGNAFVAAFEADLFVAALGRTALLALIVTVLVVVVGTLYAVGVAVAPSWLRALLVVALLLSLWTSVLVRTFGWQLLEIPQGGLYWALHGLGLTDEPVTLYQTTLGMYPAMISVMLPFAVLPVLASVNSLDSDQLNAATIFGAGPLLTLRTVILPHLAAGISTAGVLVFVLSLGFYVTPVLLGGPANQTVSGVINLQLAQADEPAVGAAMSLLLVAATLVIYLTADRLFRVSEKWG